MAVRAYPKPGGPACPSFLKKGVNVVIEMNCLNLNSVLFMHTARTSSYLTNAHHYLMLSPFSYSRPVLVSS